MEIIFTTRNWRRQYTGSNVVFLYLFNSTYSLTYSKPLCFHFISFHAPICLLFLFYPLHLSLVELVAMYSPISPLGYVFYRSWLHWSFIIGFFLYGKYDNKILYLSWICRGVSLSASSALDKVFCRGCAFLLGYLIIFVFWE